MTNYKDQHPGGPVAFTDKAGRHASLAFAQVGHSENAKNEVMPKYRIGRVFKDSEIESWQKESQSSGHSIINSVIFLTLLVLAIYYLFAY
mgnify:CR=1 FL=1